MRIQLPNTNITLTDDDEEIKKTIDRIQMEVGLNHPNYKTPDTTKTLEDWVFVHIEPAAKSGDVVLYFIRYHAKANDSGYLCFELNNFFSNRKELEVLIDIFNDERDAHAEKSINILRTLKEMASFAQLAASGILSTPPPSMN